MSNPPTTEFVYVDRPEAGGDGPARHRNAVSWHQRAEMARFAFWTLASIPFGLLDLALADFLVKRLVR